MIILSALSAAIAIVCAHVIASRLGGPGGTVSRFVVVAALGLVLYATWAIRSYGLTADVVSSLLVLLFCCELYLFVITLSFASVSANVLTRLLSGPLSAEGLEREYSGTAMSTRRAERLKQARLVVAEPEGLRLTRKGNVIVGAMSTLRRLFGHDPIDATQSPTPRLPAAAVAIGFFALMFAPCVAVLWSGTAIAHFEEAVGYRYFYGLRVLFGHENPWLPQGHTLGLVQHVLQLLLWGAGLGVEDLDTRINAFIALNAAFWLGFAAYLLYRLCRELPNIGIGITVVGALYLLSNAPTAELYWYAYPDYPSVTLVLAVATALWVWRLVTQDAERELTAGRMMFLGLFAGLAIANKITNLVYPLTIGLLFVVYDRRNLKPLIGAAVISVFVFWVVLVAFYLRLDSGEMYLEGLRTFLLSQIKHVGPLAFVRFFGTLVTSHLWDGLFLAPLLVAVIGVAGVSDVRFRPALACLPGLGFIAYFLFQRYYSWSAIEVYLFIWVCLCTLLFLAITANFRLPKWAFAGAMTVAVCFMAADVARRSEEALRFFAPFSNAYGEMRNAVAGKRVLNLTAGNTYRLISPYSAMCKGGMNIFSPHWGDSRFFLRKFPSYHCEVTDIGDPRLADAEVVIFRRLEPDNLTQAIRRNEEYFKLSLGEFDCSISIPVPLGDFVACLRKQ